MKRGIILLETIIATTVFIFFIYTLLQLVNTSQKNIKNISDISNLIAYSILKTNFSNEINVQDIVRTNFDIEEKYVLDLPQKIKYKTKTKIQEQNGIKIIEKDINILDKNYVYIEFKF